MDLVFDKELLMSLLTRVGGKKGILERWSKLFLKEPHRDTLHAWVTGKRLPGTLEKLLQFCACLDIDPLSIIKFAEHEVTPLVDRMLSKSLLKIKNDGINAEDVVEIFGPTPNWPDDRLIYECFARKWNRQQFHNPGQQQPFFQKIRISADQVHRPVVVHFAYRGPKTKLWRVYGFVTLGEKSNHLTDYFHGLKSNDSDGQSPVEVETHFGVGECSFMLASLHRFSVTLVPNNSDSKSLRFEA